MLIQQNENKKAISYLVHLARFNRALLELEGLNTHSLSDKIQFAESYLRLENKRFQDDFSYSFTYHQILEEELSQYCVPPLLLQPYLENAIWHGLLPCSKKDRKISLSFTKSENTLIIELDDNGIGRQIKPLDKKTREGKGMGITKQRIDLFNKANEMNIEINIIDKMNDLGESLGTCVVLEITSNLVMA